MHDPRVGLLAVAAIGAAAAVTTSAIGATSTVVSIAGTPSSSIAPRRRSRRHGRGGFIRKR